MAAPTYVSGASFVNGILGSSTATVTKPAGIANGDLLLAFIGVNNLSTITPPSDWDVYDMDENTVLTMQTRLYYKFITNAVGEPASYTWSFTSGACAAVVEAWRGVGFIYQAFQDRDLLALLAHTTPTLNNLLSDVTVVTCFTGTSVLSLGWSAPSGTTERFDVIGGLPILLNVNMAVADGSAAVGVNTKTSNTLTTVQGLAALVLLAPIVTQQQVLVSEVLDVTQSTFARTFTDAQRESTLDLDDCIGQRTGTFRFDLVNVVTGYRRAVQPIRNTVPVLTHDTTRVIKRTLTNINFDAATTASLNVISDRLEVFMLIAGQEFPLGQYVFNDDTTTVTSAGNLAFTALYDLGFIVAQPLTRSFPLPGAFDQPQPVVKVIPDILTDVPITYTLESSPFDTPGSWRIGSDRGYALEQLALDGDYLPPWFDNTNIMRFIRSFDPATAVPTFDLDTGNRVIRDNIIQTSDLITAANRFIVISNGSSDLSNPIVGTYDVPSSAPHSIANRGFIIPEVIDRQAIDTAQVAAIAQNLGQQQTVFQRIELYTPPDPRHDSYDVLRWQGANWLEISWTMPLVEGGLMRHVARRAYLP